MSQYLRVLVVHRQNTVVDDIKRQFDSAGWLVHKAHCGLDGLLAARKESFSLIVSSIDLPVITGIEMVRGIRNFSFNLNTPVVFVDLQEKGDYEAILNKLKAKVYSSDLDDLSSLTRMFDRSGSKESMMVVES